MEITAAELTASNIPRQYHWRIRSRLAVLTYAGDHGVRGASRRFGLDRKIIRKWRRRWQAEGAAGLVPRYPAERPRRIGQPIVDLIEQARRDLHYGVVRTQIWLCRVHSVTLCANDSAYLSTPGLWTAPTSATTPNSVVETL